MDWKEMHERSKQFTAKNKELDSRLKSLAQHTWNVIGGDVLQCRQECGEGGDMKRSEVIETVCDADYMFMHGDDHEAYAYFIYLRDNHLKYRDKIMKEAFPYKTYGW